MTSKNAYCPQCGGSTPDAAKFCPSCGHALQGGASIAQAAASGRSSFLPRFAKLSGSHVMLVGVLTAAITGAGWLVKSNLAGAKPTTTYEEVSAKNDPSKNNPELKNLREAAEKSPGQVQGWRDLGSALLTELQTEDKPSQQLIFETIEVLRKVLDLDPSDKFALLTMADISMNQQVFDKAAEYYSRYLKDSPSDKLARSRYASALAFTGKADQAVSELNSVLKEEPTNFSALAYLAVTYAQMGKKPMALEVGARALKNAPSEEARARFSSFLDSVKNEDAPSGTASTDQASSNANSVRTEASGLKAVEAFVRSNQVAGPKFERAALVDGMVALYFKDFPMDKMPPFVKDKFTTSVREQVQKLVPEATRISFVDSGSGAEMVALKAKD
jgi:cytochrome c-type biogenesis protein CcmH/NrfG